MTPNRSASQPHPEARATGRERRRKRLDLQSADRRRRTQREELLPQARARRLKQSLKDRPCARPREHLTHVWFRRIRFEPPDRGQDRALGLAKDAAAPAKERPGLSGTPRDVVALEGVVCYGVSQQL
eukprot:3552256-Pleurochrysis_carterae.AAC.1